MSRTLLHLLIIAGLTLGISCTEDEEDISDPGIGELTSPVDLSDGTAEFIASGDENITISNATTSWAKTGKLTVNDRPYARTTLTMVDETGDVTITIEFYVHDPEAGFFGGKTPEAGMYEIGLNTDEQGSTDTDGFAEINVIGDNLITSYFDDGESTGFIEVISVDSGVITGGVDVKELFGFEDFDGYHIDAKASFKSVEE